VSVFEYLLSLDDVNRVIILLKDSFLNAVEKLFSAFLEIEQTGNSADAGMKFWFIKFRLIR